MVEKSFLQTPTVLEAMDLKTGDTFAPKVPPFLDILRGKPVVGFGLVEGIFH